MSLRLFSFTHQPMATPVTVQHFHEPDLSSAAGGAPNVIPPSHANAPSRLRGDAAGCHTTEDALFTNRADLKILTSEIAMHLSDHQRSDLFRQIDELLNSEDWTSDDQLIDPTSFRTFLRFLIHCHSVERPSLTVTGEGNIAASWFAGGERLTVEFLPGDKIRLVMYHLLKEDQGAETIAYQGPIHRIGNVVASFGQTPWNRDDSA